MARERVHFVCRQCGGVQARWMGKCPDCGTWDALERFAEPPPSPGEAASAPGDEGTPRAAAKPIAEIEAPRVARLATGIAELDRVLGGGIVAGSVILLGGDPGIGKSTLLLQAASELARRGERVLYVSSEESAHQARLRAERLFASIDEREGLRGLESLYVLAETDLTRLVEQARRIQPSLLVIDSIQMVFRRDLPGAPGSVAQVRRCCTDLVLLAKSTGMAIALVGHVTKEGELAGPRLLEHLVDVVLSFEGDRYEAHRLVRAVKNRFGATMEVGLFEMSGTGLREVAEFTRPADPLAPPRPGSVIAPLLHGSRCLIVEIQALTAPGFLGNAKRKCSGLEGNRLSMLIAVLEQHVGLRLADQDVYASSAGGIRVVDPGSDLALALAVAGAFQRRAIQPGTAVVGEVGLGGEIRMTAQVEQRVREAQRLGYASVIGPLMRGSGLAAPSGYTAVRSIQEAVEQLGPAEKPPLRARRERPSQDATGREGSGVSISTQRAQRGDSG